MSNVKTNKKFKNKIKMSNKTKSILVTVGMILLIFGVLVSINAIRNNNKNNNVPEGFESYKVTWKSGGINLEDGAMITDKAYMYSSAIEVGEELKIERDFNSGISFMVFYYNELGQMIYREDDFITTNYSKLISEIPVEEGEVVHHARIVICSLNDDDGKLSALERFKLRNKLTIYVDNVVETEE